MFLDVLAGPVIGNPYWAPVPSEPFSAAVSRRPKKLRLAAILESWAGKVDPEVKAATESALNAFQVMGHWVEQVKLDPAAFLIVVARVITTAGIASVPVEDVELIGSVVRATWEQGKEALRPPTTSMRSRRCTTSHAR